VRRSASGKPAPREAKANTVERVRRDILVLSILIAAIALLIFNGNAMFQAIMQGDARHYGPELKMLGVALTLNVALLLFGWRRYADLMHEAQRRLEGEARAALMAASDAVTGFANRKGFAERGEQLRLAAEKSGRCPAVISLRMHRLRAVNDRHGYEAGDDMLRAIAAAIAGEIDPEAVAGRLNGDEFSIAFTVPRDGSASADQLAEALLRAVSRPFAVADRMIQVGAFAGIAWAPPTETAVPDLVRRANIAMDRASTSRAIRPVWFDAGMERELIALGDIEQGLRTGLEQGQFVPFFEPQVELETGKVIGFEMLARWRHPEKGLVSPGAFIPVAEEMGLIGQLSEQVMRAALTEAASWDKTISISVNVSPTQLADPWLAQKILRLLTETGFPGERLVVEVTESSLFEDIDLARSISTSLRNQGIRLALDDFGTGFSSLSMLRSLPFDSIKIDRSFVSTIHHEPQNAAIVRAVTSLANAIDVPVTVEGIEDEATHATVLGFGCAVGQGWYFGKPMTARRAADLLDRRDAAPAPARAAAR
jgi:diguanylate cyclase (GGDEF)-like protein